MTRPSHGICRAAALRLATLCLAACCAALPALANTGAGQAAPGAPAAEAPPAPPARPRIGLVLSGGGARGLAHVGVLKVLERQGVPIDVIAGTSMGAIVGGLYASGMTASEIERELRRIDWNRIFDLRVDRQELSQRRKEEDFDVGSGFELGLTLDGEIRLPQGAVSSRGLETLLRRYTLPVRAVHDFAHLPIPFRAVATDMETGAAVVLTHGDLALALRSSMSVPGVFPPIDLEGRMLGDGGLVDNLPVDVARAMGADVVIAVNIGTPLGRREALNSVLGLTAQMITILTEQNVQRSLATLDPDRDLLIAPDLGDLTAADFGEAQRFIALGQAGAERHAARLDAWSLPPSDYARWLAQRRLPDTTAPALDFVEFAGTRVTNPARFEAQLRSQPGRAFDAEDAASDARRLAASGDYLRADYRLVSTPSGATGLQFDLEDKPWGPNYLRVGLDLSTDFDGHSAFNIKLSHNRKWLTRKGTEWRNLLQVGEAPQFATEVYHPLSWTNGLANDWFVAGWAAIERRLLTLYGPDAGGEVGQLRRVSRRWGVELGQTWGSVGEFRFGLVNESGTTEPTLLSADYDGPTREAGWSEGGLRTRVVIDQLDYAWFPQRGYRLEAEGLIGGKVYQEAIELLARVEAEFTAAHSWGRHTLSVLGRVQAGDPHANAIIGQYSLGGFHQLSGYRPQQLAGAAVVFGRLNWYTRLVQPPVFARGLYLGATLEAGNAWATRRQMNLGDLRLGSSVYLGADTSIGPMFLGLTWAPEGKVGLALVIGRP